MKCVLPETFPTIRFDTAGVCNYCHAFRDGAGQEDGKARYRNKFETLVAEKAGRGGYDILVAYSGGKDSTYTLDLLKNRYHLRILAMTFDNGFMSAHALNNIRTVIERLGIDHYLFKPSFELLRRVFLSSARQNPYTIKSLERASSICTTCMLIVKSVLLKTAIEKKIPLIGYGWSPGQAPVHASVVKTSPSLIRSTQGAVYGNLRSMMGEDAPLYFLNEEEFRQTDRFPYLIHPLAFTDYNESVIYGRIRSLGWAPPDDTDPNSTNCMMNAFAIHIHLKQHRFHPYAFEISGLVRSGVMSRDEGLERIYAPENAAVIDQVARRLGYAE